mgnify:CR=1 FL=1
MRLQRIYVGLMASLAVALLARPLIRAADQSSWSIGIGAVATVATVLAVTAAAWVFRIRRVGLVVSFVVAGVLWLGATVMMSAAPVAAQTETDLENAILTRARQLNLANAAR